MRAMRSGGDVLQGAGAMLLGAALAILGAINLARGDFTIVYHPMPDFLPARALIALLCNLALLAGGLAVALGYYRRAGAAVLAGVLVVLSLGWAVRVAMFPGMIGTWLGLAEQLALATGALAVYARVAGPARLSTACCIAFGLFQLVFALGHFLALPETMAMTPAYIPPGPRFWALATGALHLGGGVLLLAGLRPLLATRLLAVMFMTFGLLVWLPMLLKGPAPATWAGNLINLALVGAVLAVGDAVGAKRR